MHTGPDLRNRLRSRRADGARHWAPSASLLVPLVVVVALLALIPVAVTSLLVAGGAIGLVGLIIMVSALGADKASNVLMVLAFGFAPLTSFSLGLKPFVLASLFFFLAVALVLPRLVRQPLRLPSTLLVGTLLFTVMGLVSVPLAISAIESTIYVATAVIALFAMPAVIVWMRPTHRQIYIMMIAFGIGTAASTIYGIPHNVYRNAGFTYHPVALAYTAMLTLSFVPYLLSSTKMRSRWFIVPPIAAVALVGVWTSGSRTSLLVLICLAILVPVLERSFAFGLLFAAGAVILMPTVLSFDPSRGETNALSRLFGAGGASNSDDTRLGLLQNGLDQVQENPVFGNGYSTEHTYTIHNLYVQVLAAEGVIGLVGILLMLLAFIGALRHASPLQRCLAYPAVSVILAGPFQPNMGDHYLGMALGLSLVGAVGAFGGRDAPEDPTPDEEERPQGTPAQVRV